MKSWPANGCSKGKAREYNSAPWAKQGWLVALDNLCKGSSGQAIQNANLMLGNEETAGLMLAPVFP